MLLQVYSSKYILSNEFPFPYYVKHCTSTGATKKKEKISIYRDVHTSKINICLIKLLFCNEISFLLQKLSWKIYLCGWIILRFNSQWKLTVFSYEIWHNLMNIKIIWQDCSVEHYIHFPRIRSIHFLSKKKNLLKQQDFIFCKKILFCIQLTV